MCAKFVNNIVPKYYGKDKLRQKEIKKTTCIYLYKQTDRRKV